ncbi:MAG: Fic family protein [Sphaerochaetaceae bacterium]
MELQHAMNLRDEKHFRRSYLHPALQLKVIEMTIPEKPTSSKQRYRVSESAKHMVANTDNDHNQ